MLPLNQSNPLLLYKNKKCISGKAPLNTEHTEYCCFMLQVGAFLKMLGIAVQPGIRKSNIVK
jgi:hypothetical protein